MRSQKPGAAPAARSAVAAEHVRMAADHLGGDGVDDVGEGEGLPLLGHAGVIDDLQQEVAQLVLQAPAGRSCSMASATS